MTNPKKAKTTQDPSGTEATAASDEAQMLSGEDEDLDADSDDDESASEESSDEDLANIVVNVDFEAVPPIDSDFHGIKKLLQQLFRNARVNLSDLANQLIELNKLSVILRQEDAEMADESDDEDESDVLGVTSIIPLHTEREGAKSVRQFILEKASAAKDSSIRSKLESLISNESVALLVSERYVNIPPRVASPLLGSIRKDWEEVRKSIRSLAKVQYLLMICKLYVGANEVIYANGEEELFVDLSELEFEFEVPQQDADSAISGKWKRTDEELKQIRKVLLLDMKKLPQMIQLVDKNV